VLRVPLMLPENGLVPNESPLEPSIAVVSENRVFGPKKALYVIDWVVIVPPIWPLNETGPEVAKSVSETRIRSVPGEPELVSYREVMSMTGLVGDPTVGNPTEPAFVTV